MVVGQAYGEAGVVKLIRIMEREITTGMRLMGAARVEDLTPDLVSQISKSGVIRLAHLLAGSPGRLSSKALKEDLI